MTKAGDRVRLDKMDDPYTNIRPGALGTVKFVDSLGTVHVEWDDGRRLGLVPGEDQWSVIEEYHVAGAITADGPIPSPETPEGWGVTWV